MKIPNIIVIGAGFTGCAIAYDLAMRGFNVTVLDRGDIASGTSGRTHGLLHSGGRYCVDDHEAARECIQENIILRRIACQCIEYNGGFFVALNNDDLAYQAEFLKGAAICGIPVEEVPVKKALQLEPNINPDILAAFLVPDGSFDPLRLALAFAASAKVRGAIFRPYHEVTGFQLESSSRIHEVEIWDRNTGNRYALKGDLVVNATGAWAGKISELAHVHVPVIPTPGVMVAFDQRLIQRVINRLNKPGDGDILIPQRRMVVIGTTSFEVEDADFIPVVQDQINSMIDHATQLVPAVSAANLRGAYMSARPLIGTSVQGRSLSRTFKCYDHKEIDGLEGLITITGGKATTCRVMAEKTVDLICQKFDKEVSCTTHEHILNSYRDYYA
jgi:glycerol-3-phosphate dehydrogenase